MTRRTRNDFHEYRRRKTEDAVRAACTALGMSDDYRFRLDFERFPGFAYRRDEPRRKAPCGSTTGMTLRVFVRDDWLEKVFDRGLATVKGNVCLWAVDEPRGELVGVDGAWAGELCYFENGRMRKNLYDTYFVRLAGAFWVAGSVGAAYRDASEHVACSILGTDPPPPF